MKSFLLRAIILTDWIRKTDRTWNEWKWSFLCLCLGKWEFTSFWWRKMVSRDKTFAFLHVINELISQWTFIRWSWSYQKTFITHVDQMIISRMKNNWNGNRYMYISFDQHHNQLFIRQCFANGKENEILSSHSTLLLLYRTDKLIDERIQAWPLWWSFRQRTPQ